MMTEVTTLHGLLLRSASRRPEKLCLKFGSHVGYSYREVQEAMDRCAGHLVLLESPVVAIVAERSYGLVVSLLGVLRAGRAYCPIEPDCPCGRAGVMLGTAGIKDALVPADQLPLALLSHFNDLNVLAVHDSGRVDNASSGERLQSRGVPKEVPDNSTAYVLFTSGSTGKPKGVMVPHRGSANYANAVVQSCQLDESMVFVFKTPYVFDVSIQDMFVAFCAGGTLVIAPPGAHKDASAMADLIGEHKVNCICFVPTLLVEFCNYLSSHPEEAAKVRTSLRRLLTIGEALMSDTCRQMFECIPELQIHNLYGPTEASVGVSHHCATKETLDVTAAVVPIGKEFGYVNFSVFDPSKYEDKAEILASDLVAMKDGEIGELFIGGDCLAQGYIANPEKTAEAFFDFPGVLPRPTGAASKFSLYKTGDLVKKRPDGVFEYLGRNDFQVKIGGVRIECEEVSAVLKTHPFVEDALVTAFEGPFGKALAAYIVASDVADWSEALEEGKTDEIAVQDSADNVSKWGAVYDEMYKEAEAISDQDPTLNWSGYIDTYSRKPHIEPVIKEWVEWSCEQVSRHLGQNDASKQCVTELGCGTGMLLFRLAPQCGSQCKYIGTDISTTALEYVHKMTKRPEYKDLNIETAQLAAHEIMKCCKEKENDMVLCNGVTMYFPSTEYLLDCMKIAARATRSDGFVIFGDIQSKRHLLPFRCHVETYHALRRADATVLAVLRAAKQTAAHEELSYFDDALFHRLDRSGAELFDGRLARVEMRLKPGWWHSEFNRFRFDIELVMCNERVIKKDPELMFLSFEQLSEEMQLQACPDVAQLMYPDKADLVDPKLRERLPAWLARRLAELPACTDGIVVKLPNARTLQSARLMLWLEENANKGKTLAEMPHVLHPVDAEKADFETSSSFGMEPEELFNLQLPEGWKQRVIWDEDPAFLRLVLLRDAAAEQPWLGAVCGAPAEPLPADLAMFKNRPEDVPTGGFLDPVKACNDALKAWTSKTTLLPVMLPSVFIPMDAYPKNTAGKTDRNALPDANEVFLKVSDATTIAYEAPATEAERKMVEIWEPVLKVTVGVSTPFTAYGGHSLTAISLCQKIFAGFGQRPELAFLTSEDCTVRALLAKMEATEGNQDSGSKCVVRLSPPEQRGCNLLIFCAAGTGAEAYQAVAKHLGNMQVYAVELPGRGQHASEAFETDFVQLVDKLEVELTSWTERRKEQIYLWGDSLGAVIAYTFACKWQGSKHISLLGFFVSGNAGPLEASAECGMGSSASGNLGLNRTSAADMSHDDWVQFLVASSGKKGEETRKLLEDKELAGIVLGSLQADCLVYESYHLDRAISLRMPIMTMRGGLDRITAPGAMKTWSKVAGGRVEHKEFQHAGHMVASECPALVARYISQATMPDFSDELDAFNTFRAAYRLQRSRTKLHEASRMPKFKEFVGCTPVLGATAVPQDMDMIVDFSLLDGLNCISPPTKQMKEMRVGNMEWRKGGYTGNTANLP
ncbi:unnamed protein product [Polarella glacialis]|uniref:Carrier domain-containing protein n=1 Tax=Polarella glacialis TaxID=89957 RepID=A0A813JQR3_POLGL|nr:unnamed protein product [Polarella glacialis]